MRNTDYDIFSVVSSTSNWEWLVGYTARSKTVDHFLRHIGIRYKKICNMSQLNNAHYSRDIVISILDDMPKRKRHYQADHIRKPKIVNEYCGGYGYFVEVKYDDEIKKIIFATEEEANEWKKIFQSK